MIVCKDINNKYIQLSIEEYNNSDYEFMFKDTVNAIDANGKIFRINKSEFDKRDDLHGHTKNKFAAKDKDGNIHHIFRTDPRYLSGELVAESKGRVWCKEAKDAVKQERSQRRWIYNDTLLQTKFISKDIDVFLQDGWLIGRKFFNK